MQPCTMRRTWKKGQSWYILRSSSAWPASTALFSASPTPSHEGRIRRVCTRARVHNDHVKQALGAWQITNYLG